MSVPASAGTRASGHHATPRSAYSPSSANDASQASVGHGTIRPRRAMSRTTSAADPKNSSPATVRMLVGCHSLMRAVTSGFADSATA